MTSFSPVQGAEADSQTDTEERIDEVIAEDKLLAAAFDKAKALSQMEGKNYAAIKHSFRTPVAEKIAAYGAVNLGG